MITEQCHYYHLLINKVNDQAQLDYKPEPYHGKIILFKPVKHYAGLDDPYFGWGKFALGGVEIVNTPSRPRGILTEPFVKWLAEIMTTKIGDATRVFENELTRSINDGAGEL